MPHRLQPERLAPTPTTIADGRGRPSAEAEGLRSRVAEIVQASERACVSQVHGLQGAVACFRPPVQVSGLAGDVCHGQLACRNLHSRSAFFLFCHLFTAHRRLYTLSHVLRFNEMGQRAEPNSKLLFRLHVGRTPRSFTVGEMSMIASGGSRSQSRLRLLEGFPSRPRVTREARRRLRPV
jgi:hypothetical protein